MPLSPRLSRLERTAKARAAKAAMLGTTADDAERRATVAAIMSDVTAFELMGECLRLCPMTTPNTPVDMAQAIANRPELARAATALCERLDAIEAAA